ncbi:hypothetical protein F4782DRAFT_191076 [Xylaria castorea]|nr:hypothetical protein F4782DRAFT_191076 [Xylaria castorea]
MSSSGHDDDSPERLAGNPIGVGTTANTRRVKKKRVRNFTEDDRAAHRIFEKSRREAFKEALIVSIRLLHLRLLPVDERAQKNLASLLPALADTEPQRLSKHVVVDAGITVIRSQHEQIKTMTERLDAVETERDELLAELNHWRSGAGIELRQANTIVHHGDTSAAPKAMLSAVSAALQPTESPINVIGEAAPSFITNSLHKPNPPPIPTDSNAGMHWEGFDPQIHAFANHVHGENGPNNIGNAEPSQLDTYQTPRSPDISQFNMERGQQHGVVFLPFESPQSFDPGFQADTFMQNAVPLQDYIPP